MRRDRGHRAVPHTADVILEAWAPDLAGCLEEAVAALAATYAEPGASAPPSQGLPVELPPGPADQLLLDLLDEVVFALDTADGVPVGARVRRRDDGSLDATLWLVPADAVVATGSVPKAVSHSELHVVEGADGVTCRFLVDV